jgi:Rps23 Pro-64 3,4-dihydroxylase Tpa1-like proline 4-hydroxylase
LKKINKNKGESMKVNVINPFGIVVIEDVFTTKEKGEIFLELSEYVTEKKLLGPEQTGSATYEDGTLKKKNSAVFLDNLYPFDQRDLSSILKYSQQRLLSHKMKETLQEFNYFYGILGLANNHYTLVNYYEDSDYYDFHHDDSVFSILSFFFNEPKSFSGGNVIFKINEEEFEIEIKNNMSIFFPSFYSHKVLPVKMHENINSESVLGRFSIAHFVYILP